MRAGSAAWFVAKAVSVRAIDAGLKRMPVGEVTMRNFARARRVAMFVAKQLPTAKIFVL